MEPLTKKSKALLKKLTVRERLFCKHYLAGDYNGSKAAIAAGFSEKNSRIIAHQVLQKPMVKKYLAQRLREVEKKLDVKFEQKMKLLWKTAKRCYGITDEELERIKNDEDVKRVFNFEPEALIKAIAELNKMQGHYADAKKFDDNPEDNEKLSEEIKKHEREY